MNEIATFAGVPAVSADEMERLLGRAGELARAARSANTRRAYRSRLSNWLDWSGLGVEDPIRPEAIIAWIGWMEQRGLASSTVDLSLAALRDLHASTRPGEPSPLDHPAVRLVRAGARRVIGTAPQRQAHPFVTDEVKAVVAAIAGDSPVERRDRAMLLLGFAAALRRSEIAALDVEHVRRRGGDLLVSLARSKGDQEGAGGVVGVARGSSPESCPVRAVAAWLEVSGASVGALFPKGHRSGAVVLGSRLTAGSVNRIIQRRARAAGLGDLPVSGHSLRSGHATTASANGARIEQIAATARHVRIDTTRRYTRDTDAMRHSTSRHLGL